jgi:hypothetical protein
VSEPSPTIERKVLSEAFQEAIGSWRLRSAVFLTFRFDPGFFEQEILPIFFDIPMSHAPLARVLHLVDKLRETGPIAVYYDRRALEAGAAPARTDFQRIGVIHRTGYFHPKNALLLIESTASDSDEAGKANRKRLVVGSMSANVTRAGWWENVEVAHIEMAEEDQLCAFRDDLLALISFVRRTSPEGSDHAALDEIHAFVRKLEQDPQRLSGGLLTPRMFTGDRDLPEFLEALAGNRLRNRYLEVISPYFDDKESSKPLRELIERFRPRETRVFLPKGSAGEALCSEHYWNSIREIGAIWATLPRDVVRLSRDTDRFVHAKVYRFFDPDDRRETFFIGSVNLTNAGFGRAGNVEAGFLVEREGKRKSEWWLETEERRPAAFLHQSESEDLVVGPGVNLVLRFDWATSTARALWDAEGSSPRLIIRATGVTLGEIEPLESRKLTVLDQELAERLKERLLSSSFVTVAVEGAPDAIVLVDEEASTDKPSLLSTITPDEILRFWSLLTDAQKQEFFETHADELGDDQVALWIGADATRLVGQDGIFGKFAHVYLSFGNLERAVRRALAAGRQKEAVDRLFGRKFDSLRRFVERISEKPEPDPVRDYVTLLCAIQLLDVLRKEEPDFYARERRRFDLSVDSRAALETVKARFTFAAEEDRRPFFDWLEHWFLRRAAPALREPVA